MKSILMLTLLIALSTSLCRAQKQSFDVVSYVSPKGWKKEIKENGIQLYTTDDKTGEYALALIIKSTSTNADANENFNSTWEKLVKATVSVTQAPVMNEPSNEKGWQIISGQAHYTDGNNKGLATLITATGNDKMANVVLMTNTQKYQNELLEFLNTVELNETATTQNSSGTSSAKSNSTTNSSIVGLWCYYTTESNGSYNGFPQLTGGYFRKEYRFYPDGTYLYRIKNWAVLVKEIQFVYEFGKWKINGNKLTITPTQGKAQLWSKAASGSTKEWGKLVKEGSWKLEPVTYTFDFNYSSLINETDLVIKSVTQTEREGQHDNNTVIYNPRGLDKGLIDNPPGLKTGFEDKSLTSAVKSPVTNNLTGTINSPLTGKIWEGTAKEKFIDGATNGFNTGGFFTYQYKFNSDGSYHFTYIGASAYTAPNVLQYETGTYSINGNQLTIAPISGSNEEWNTIGGPVRISAMNDVQIHKIKSSWSNKIKTEKRKLETYTYNFKVEYLEGNKTNALILQFNGHTEREGNGSQQYYFETASEKASVFPKP